LFATRGDGAHSGEGGQHSGVKPNRIPAGPEQQSERSEVAAPIGI
jgi:hypothetical protein